MYIKKRVSPSEIYQDNDKDLRIFQCDEQTTTQLIKKKKKKKKTFEKKKKRKNVH